MRRALALLALLLTLGAAPASAQLGRKSWEFFPHVGALLPGDPKFLEGVGGFEGFDPGTLWGFYATYHYSDHVGVEMGFSKGTANGPEEGFRFVAPGTALADGATAGDVGFDFWELNGFLNSNALARLQLFATAGGGLVNFDPEGGGGVTRLLLDGGVGVRYYAWQNIALRAEVKDYVFPGAEVADYASPFACDEILCAGAGDRAGEEDTVHNIGAYAGISFNF